MGRKRKWAKTLIARFRLGDQMRYTLKPADTGGGGGGGAFDGPAELPRVQVDTTYSTPTGTTWVVNSGDNLQTALNSAALNDIIQVAAGATFTGNFTLPNKTSGSGWIYIVSSALGSLPAAGTRVGTGDASNMPHLVVGSGSILAADNAAHHYRFVGIHVSPTTGTYLNALVDLSGSGSQANLPHHIIFDRCYLHGDATNGTRRAIALNCATAAVVDSYISDCKEVGADTQAIGGWNGPGPFKIQNNYLEGAGENVMFGGAAATITDLIPSDIEIIRNHFFKPLTWMVGHPSYGGTHWSVKNIFELKNAQRVLVEGNHFEHCWQDGQVGFAIVFTVRSNAGVNPWAVVQDVTFRHNVLRSSASGINIMGIDDTYESGGAQRFSIHNNLILDIDSATWGGDGILFQLIRAANSVTIAHNTCRCTGHVVSADYEASSGFDYEYNISPHNTYGVFGSGQGTGTACLNYYYPGYVFVGNVLADHPEQESSYPANNYFPNV